MICKRCKQDMYVKNFDGVNYFVCDTCKIKFPVPEDDECESYSEYKPINKCLLISFVWGLCYLAYMGIVWGQIYGSGTTHSEVLGISVAMVLVAPHLVFTFLGIIFNMLGLFLRNRWFALSGAILYTIALLILIPYFVFLLVPIILSFIGFAKS